MSELIVNSKEGIKQIKEIQFGVFSPSEIAKISTKNEPVLAPSVILALKNQIFPAPPEKLLSL